MPIGEVKAVPGSIGGSRGVFATTDISSGSLIVLEWPSLLWNGAGGNETEVLLAMVEQVLENKLAYQHSLDLYPRTVSDIPSQELQELQSKIPETNFQIITLSEKFSQPVSEIHRLLLVIQHNAFGSGLYYQLCMINHSCEPNCVKFEPRSASRGASEVWSIRPIRAGEEITISYVTPIEKITPTMKEYLFQQHYFDCQCSRCQQFETISTSIVSQPVTETNNDPENKALSYVEQLVSFEKLIEAMEEEVQEFIQLQTSSTFVISSEEDEDIQKLSQKLKELLQTLQVFASSRNNEDDNLERLTSRLSMVQAMLKSFHIEMILIPYYQKLSEPSVKGQLTIDHREILLDYLHITLQIYNYQSSYYHSRDHPLLSTILTDLLHAIEYLQFFLADSEILLIILERITNNDRVGQLFGLTSLPTPVKLGDFLKVIKKEISRLKSHYLLASRCREAVFVTKQPGTAYWGNQTH